LELLSSLERLRRARHGEWLLQIRAQLEEALLPGCGVYLFGSRARGDWDGFSDTDLLVVGPNQGQAELQAERLREQTIGDDVLAISRDRWEGIGPQSSPYWRAIRVQAQLLAGFSK
jgi:predicted nucleotidyltransferase